MSYVRCDIWEIEREQFETDVVRLRLLWAVVTRRWQQSFEKDKPELRKADGRRLPFHIAAPSEG